MNERIQQLAEQVYGTQATEQEIKFAAQSLIEHDGELIFSKEKFAELIVRECAELTSRYQMGTTRLPDIIVSYNYSDKLEDVLKKHFGVEE